MRKWLFILFAVFGAAGAVLSQEFGLTVQLGSAVVGLGAIAVYIFGESKNDIARMAAQKDKWKDPKFIVSVLAAIVAALGTAGVNLPVSPEIIVTILTLIVGLLFKKGVADTPVA
jgi:hypothetical protein